MYGGTDNLERYVEIVASPLADHQVGEVVAVIEAVRDVTEIKRTEMLRAEALRAVNEQLTISALTAQEMATREQSLRQMSVADGLIVFDSMDQPVRLNPAAERMFGYSIDALRRPANERAILLRVETVEGQPLTVEKAPIVRAQRGETVQSMTMCLYAADGRKLWVSSRAAPIHTPEGKALGAVVTITDITELHKLQG